MVTDMDEVNERYERQEPIPSVKYPIRPNNYAVKVALISGQDQCHLASRKVTGNGVIKEYEYLPDVTIEKSTRSIIIYLKRRWVKVITKEEEYDKIDPAVKDYLVTKLLEFMVRFPKTQLDYMNAKLIRREIGVKDSSLKVSPSLRMRDTIFKKVYNNKEIEFYNPVHLKNYIKNRAIEDWSPELAKKMDFIIDQQNKFAQNLCLHLEVLTQLKENTKPRMTLWQRIKRFLMVS